MKLARLGEPGAEIPVVEKDGAWLDARSVTDDFDPTFFADDGLERLRKACDDLPELAGAAQLRCGSAIGRPGAIVCIGMNYAAHAAESGSEPPEYPVLFLKLPNTVVGPTDDVAIPRTSTKTDWEVELGVVIGRTASYLDSPAAALECVAGYIAVNDLSERDFQLAVSGGQWSKGKCSPGFTPTGPWFVSADAVDPQQLGLRSFVNGEPRQNSNSSDMIFSVGELIHHLSQYLQLDPGDLVLTGTPQGVALSGRYPYLTPGDVVEVEIDGLGATRTTMV